MSGYALRANPTYGVWLRCLAEWRLAADKVIPFWRSGAAVWGRSASKAIHRQRFFTKISILAAGNVVSAREITIQRLKRALRGAQRSFMACGFSFRL